MPEKNIEKELCLNVDAEELKKRQSVRTTFKLSEKTINLLKTSARHLGIQQKTLLSQLLEDETVLNILAKKAQIRHGIDDDCRPKTFVLSRKALDLIGVMLNQYDISRDALVELSIFRLAPYIESLSEKHDQRRSILTEIKSYQQYLEVLSNKAKEVFEQDDPFRIKLERLTRVTQKSVGEIKKTVKEKHEFIY